MCKYVLLIALILLSQTLHAEEDITFVDGALGVFHSGQKGLSETKSFGLGVQETIWGPWKDRFIGGGWIDDAGGGKKDSLFVGGQIGFEVNSNGLVAGIFTGPSLISSPDVLLGGYFEFIDDIHLGIQDKQNNYFGAFYRHLSDAGLTSTNVGRDMIGLEIRFPF